MASDHSFHRRATLSNLLRMNSRKTGEEVIKMRVVAPPKEEDKVLASTKKDASTQEVHASAEIRGESCVDHLCGCKK